VVAVVVAKVEILADHRILVLADRVAAAQAEPQMSMAREFLVLTILAVVVAVQVQMLGRQLVIPTIIVQ
jgi:FAD synthase